MNDVLVICRTKKHYDLMKQISGGLREFDIYTETNYYGEEKFKKVEDKIRVMFEAK